MASREKRTRTPSESPIKALTSDTSTTSEKSDKSQQPQPAKRNRSIRLKNAAMAATQDTTENQPESDTAADAVTTSPKEAAAATTTTNDMKAPGNRVARSIGDSTKKSPTSRNATRNRAARSCTDLAKKRNLIKRKSLPLTKGKGDKPVTVVSSAVQRRSLPVRKTRGSASESSATTKDSKRVVNVKVTEKNKPPQQPQKVAKGKEENSTGTTPTPDRQRKLSKNGDDSVEPADTNDTEASLTAVAGQIKTEVEDAKIAETENKAAILEQMAQNFSEVEFPSPGTLTTIRRSGRPRRPTNKERSEDASTPKVIEVKHEEV